MLKTLKIIFLKILTSQYGFWSNRVCWVRIWQWKVFKTLKICKVGLILLVELLIVFSRPGGSPNPWVRIRSRFLNPNFTRRTDGEVKDTPWRSLDHTTNDISNESSHRGEQLCLWDRQTRMLPKDTSWKWRWGRLWTTPQYVYGTKTLLEVSNFVSTHSSKM